MAEEAVESVIQVEAFPMASAVLLSLEGELAVMGLRRVRMMVRAAEAEAVRLWAVLCLFIRQEFSTSQVSFLSQEVV